MADTSGIVNQLRQVETAARAVNATLPERQDVDGVTVTDKELLAWYRAFSKATRRAYQDDAGINIDTVYSRNVIPLMIGLLASKKLFNTDFKGTEPEAGYGVEFGSEAGFFGKGRDWDSDYSITGGTPANWIHSGSSQLSGTNGNPILIGKNVYHVILGYGIYYTGVPRTLKIIETIGAAQLPVIVAEEAFRTTKEDEILRIRELDVARFLAENTQYKVEVQTRVTNAASEWLKPIVVTYAQRNVLINTDLGNLSATNLNNLGVLNTT